MLKALRSFWIKEDGAVTVDWVVLAAAVIGLGILAVGTIQSGTVTKLSEMWADVDANIAAMN